MKNNTIPLFILFFAITVFFVVSLLFNSPQKSEVGAKGKVSSETDISKTICNPNWSTSSIRPPTSYTMPIKESYARTEGVDLKGYELDHAVPIELLGDPSALENLWLQPYPEAHQKDAVENLLKRKVCGGTMKLEMAQHQIMYNWKETYQKEIVKNLGSASFDDSDEDDI